MRLGNFRLPIETIPFATESIIAKLAELKLGPVLRKEKGVAFLTDEQNYIVDINIVEIDDIEAFNQFLIQIPGIVETGLFIGYTDILIVGKGDSTLIFKKDMK
jgi:ribose 5-phosphate isomerase A